MSLPAAPALPALLPPRRGSHALHARSLRDTAQRWLARGVPAIVVQVAQIKGSTPREVGTRMLVTQPGAMDTTEAVVGTIGGGHLEWQAIEMARHSLREARGAQSPAWERTFPLGPTLGQCCGGVVVLAFEPLTAESLAAWQLPPPRFHLELHGAGHVGQAIVHLLRDLDCTVRWIDERADIEHDDGDAPGLPSPEALAALPPHIQFLPTDAAHAEVKDAPAGACHIVLTHRHDLDLRIIHAVLQRGDFRFAGLIGSQTKRARFLHRLEELGTPAATLARLTCPIGLPDLPGKEPAVIAISVVAQLLQHTGQPA